MRISTLRRMQDDSRDRDIYDIAAETTPSPKRSAPRPVLNPAAAHPLPYRSPQPKSTTPVDTEAIKNLHMPMWLLGGGVAIESIAILLHGGGPAIALMSVGIELVLGTLVMLAGILLAARLRHIDLGGFWIACFKLAAISVAPAAIADLATPVLGIIPFGGLLALVGEFVLYFALLGALFDLDESDTWFCVWIIFVVRLAVYFSLMVLLAKWA